jgi:perosamine synthetase
VVSSSPSPFINVNEPLLNGNESKYVLEAIQTGWISSEGPFVQQFERGMAQVAGRKHAVAVCNGSVALEVAVAALDIGPGDEVILPSFTIISCAAPIVRVGAIPVLVDADPVTWNMNIDDLESKITSRTKAIMVVHIYGLPVDMDPVLALAAKHDLKIIEDAAEMHGQTYKGKPCGSFGDLSVFSFYPNKHVTTGEGGMVLTNDDALAERCRSLRNLCFVPERRFVHWELGHNFRMTNLQAALGVAQLERLDEFVVRKRAMGKRYTEAFADLKGLQLPLPVTSYAENIYWVFGMVLDDSIPLDAMRMMQLLKEKGVGTRPFFFGMHEQPVFRDRGLFAEGVFPVTERLGRRGFYIPSGLGLSDDQMSLVIERVRSVFREIQ